jgi:hypothetical protein
MAKEITLKMGYFGQGINVLCTSKGGFSEANQRCFLLDNVLLQQLHDLSNKFVQGFPADIAAQT